MTGVDDLGTSCCLPPVEVIPKSESVKVISLRSDKNKTDSLAGMIERTILSARTINFYGLRASWVRKLTM
jgi:hypothetical protein